MVLLEEIDFFYFYFFFSSLTDWKYWWGLFLIFCDIHFRWKANPKLFSWHWIFSVEFVDYSYLLLTDSLCFRMLSMWKWIVSLCQICLMLLPTSWSRTFHFLVPSHPPSLRRPQPMGKLHNQIACIKSTSGLSRAKINAAGNKRQCEYKQHLNWLKMKF